MVSDNWWNTDNCLKLIGDNNTTLKFFGTDTIKGMFNKSLTLSDNLKFWNTNYFNESYTKNYKFFKDDSQLTTFCHTLKSLSIEGPKNFSDIETNVSSIFEVPGKSVEFLNQLRNCFNGTLVTPAEEYWE